MNMSQEIGGFVSTGRLFKGHYRRKDQRKRKTKFKIKIKLKNRRMR